MGNAETAEAEMLDELVELLNKVFGTALILNDGHEILARLEEGDGIPDIVADFNDKFGKPEMAEGIRGSVGSWPPLHLEAVRQVLRWALGNSTRRSG